MSKDLKSKAINIKGKSYVLVSDRVIYFNETYPEGCIDTQLISEPTSEMVIVKARIWPDAAQTNRSFTGYSQAVIGDGMVNKTAALENAETSAVGRALAMMGIGVIESIASVDEINKAQGSSGGKKATDKQVEWMLDEAYKRCGSADPHEWVTALLTIKPEEVPVWKVKDAIDLIKKQPVESVSRDLGKSVDLSDDDIKKIDDGTLLNDIPY